MAYKQMTYSLATTLVKGAFGAAGGGAIGAVLLWVIGGLQTGDWSMTPETQSLVITVIVSAATALHVMAKNWWKNYLVPRLDKVTFFTGVWAALIAASALGAQGCTTMMPSLAGKTKVNTEFRDTLTAEGGQDTHYNQTIEAPAGVEVQDLSSMGYDWDPDGGGKIAISQDRGANTQGQADALVAVNAQQMELIGKLMEQIVALAGIASPLIGGKITADAELGAAAEANKATFRGQLLETLKDPDVLRALRGTRASRPAPVPPLVPTPEDDVLGVPLTLPSSGGTQ